MDDESTGTAVDEQPVESEVSPETPTAPETSATQGQPEAQPPTQESFIDVPDLLKQVRADPKLSQLEKHMLGAYTKKMQGIASVRQAGEQVQRFWSDENYASQVLQERAKQLGYQLVRPGQQSPTAPATNGTPNGAKAPAEFVEAFKSNLPPELQWMAESQANAMWQAQQHTLSPIMQKLGQQDTAKLESEIDATLQELPPGWEQYEDDMDGVMAFLQSPSQRHPVYGSKVQLLYKLVTGQATATREAITKMGKAAQNKTTSGTVARTTSNWKDRIAKTRNKHEAFQMAANAAMEQLGIGAAE